MPTVEMIPADQFCVNHHIELTFITSLKEAGLVETTIIEERLFVPVSQLSQLERMVRLYYEMDINLEGIETITYLLERMNALQQQVRQLSSRLSLYEKE